MLKRHIPTNIDIDTGALFETVASWIASNNIALGPKGYGLRGRVFFIDANPTGAQLTALRTLVAPLLATVPEL